MNAQEKNVAASHSAEAMRLVRQGLHRQAEQYLAQAISFDPDNAQWHLELARLQRLHDADLARAAYDDAQSLGSASATLEASALYAPAGEIEYVSPHALWRSDRLDIGAKLLFCRDYLDSPGENTEASALYRKHILQRTQGSEPESLLKTSLEDYEHCFTALIESIRTEGFKDAFAIPVDMDGRILNGAHRLSAALALQLEYVPVVRMPAPWKGLEWGMAWFLAHGFAPAEINQLLQLWIKAHPTQTQLLVIEHHGSGVPAELMSELRQQFPMLAWRDLHPTVPLSPFFPEDGLPLPKGPWRYVLIDTDPVVLQAFCALQNERHAHRLDCRVLSGAACAAWTSVLLDETIIASWHPEHGLPPGNASSIESWTRYASAKAATPPHDKAGFLKWRNLQLLEDIHTIIDVGVANGTPDLYNNLKPQHVVFVEPVDIFKERIEALQSRFASSQYLPIGLSSKDEEAVINYRKDLPILTSLLKSSPLRDTGSEEIVHIPVSLRRLDTVFPQLANIGHPILLKVDTEGYELEVLKGGVESLRKIKYLVLEVSVIERFEGSYTCRELFDFLHQNGFALQTCLSSSVDAEGYCRVIDSVFVNVSLL